MPGVCEQAELLIRLRDEIAGCSAAGLTTHPVIRTGWPGLDRVLPDGGVRRGAIVELLGTGAETVAAVLTRAVCRSPGVVVVVDPDGEFYPPALAAWDVSAERLVVVRPADDTDALWAADQALRSRAAAAVWLWRDRLAPHDGRRLQLSAAEGGGLGILLRPARARGQPSWADVQLAVGSRPGLRGRRLRLEVTRCRRGVPGAVAEVELDDVTGFEREDDGHATTPVPAATKLAGAAGAG
ncbi:MAG TPA: hypothetical protein VGF55_15740 [Gemmataceae bacterium]